MSGHAVITSYDKLELIVCCRSFLFVSADRSWKSTLFMRLLDENFVEKIFDSFARNIFKSSLKLIAFLNLFIKLRLCF